MFQAPARPAPAWGDMVRRASPHSGPWPRVSIWHGDADRTVVPANANEIVKQWRDVHGLPEAPTLTEDVNGHARDVWRDATGADVILYDVPSRTACGLADDTVTRLAEIPRVIGLKDATGDIARPMRLRSRLGPDFRLLAGDDATAFAFLAQGGDGCISVTSNVAPGLCRSMYLAMRHGELSRAQRLATAAMKLTGALFGETNPVPVKYALSLQGVMSPRVRLPLVELQIETRQRVAVVLAEASERFPDFLTGRLDRTPKVPLTAG